MSEWKPVGKFITFPHGILILPEDMYSTFFIVFQKYETFNDPDKEPLLVHANNQLRLKTIGQWDQASQEHTKHLFQLSFSGLGHHVS